jgi:hypothetical protein
MSPHLDPKRRALPVGEWPEADKAAWARALKAPDPFDPSVGYAMRWKASTRTDLPPN